MTDATAADDAGRRRAAIRAALAATPDGVIETLAETAGASYRTVLDELPLAAARAFPGTAFAEIWAELQAWGPVLFLVHTAAGVFEIDTALNPGTEGRGSFNIHGPAPLHGHLAASRCAAVYCVDRPFFGRRSCSVQFVDTDGAAMFKIFVKRDERREMRADQLARFEALMARAPGA
jgi:putative heme utilization carrier protein HutX